MVICDDHQERVLFFCQYHERLSSERVEGEVVEKNNKNVGKCCLVFFLPVCDVLSIVTIVILIRIPYSGSLLRGTVAIAGVFTFICGKACCRADFVFQ